MRDEILGQVKEAVPVDGVLLGVHGAMVAYGYDDVEGDLFGARAGPCRPQMRHWR
ncbi:M81 family metallopeptidase [Mesorhizobium sp. M0207]|uniref:M81 family metallopeptidase n=1 Tax=Mesorhizobium sp. M0207 TaxID=2956915 RepID=UPI0033385C70